MQRISTSTAVASRPAATSGGTPGYFTDGNAATGISGTVVDDDFLNGIQEAIANPIEASGQTLNALDDTQLASAIKVLGNAPVWSAAFAKLIDGYPNRFLVQDASSAGLFWVSTADNNLTTPGAQGASWANLFAGLISEKEAEATYFPLTGGNILGQTFVTASFSQGDETTTQPIGVALGGLQFYLQLTNDGAASATYGRLVLRDGAGGYHIGIQIDNAGNVTDSQGRPFLSAPEAAATYIRQGGGSTDFSVLAAGVNEKTTTPWVSYVDGSGTTQYLFMQPAGNYVADAGGTSGGIKAAAIDKTTGAPSFQDGNGNWHTVQPSGSYQPAGNYLETDETSQQSVAGPVSFTQNPTGTTATFGTSDKSFATTEFATRLNSGRLRGKSVFTSSGNYYPPRQDASLVFRVRLVGAGGGGATAVPQDAYACNAGAGGTAGAYVDVWFTYAQLFSGVDNTSVQVIIGNGGSANSTGGASSIGNAVTCPGGYGAPFSNAGGFSTISPAAPYSASPSFPNGVLFQDIAVPGPSGAMGVVLDPQNGGNFFAFSGNGGASPMGSSGYGVGNGTPGVAGTLGGGGGGACGARSTSGTSAQYTGGFGGNGSAIIECYEGIT